MGGRITRGPGLVFLKLGFLLLLPLVPAEPAQAGTPTYPGLTGGSAVSTTTGTATAIGSNFDITDATSVGWSSVTATVTTNGGTLTANAGDSGATVSVASNTITISGAIADVEKVLNSQGTAFARITQSSAGSASVTVAVEPSPEFNLGSTPTYFLNGNGHYYRINTSFRNWSEVNSDAQGTTVAGADGYVGVVRDQAEDDFLRATVLPNVTGGDAELRQVWLGADRGPNDLPLACRNGGSTIKSFRWIPGSNAPAGDQNVDVSPACSADQSGWTPWWPGQPSNSVEEVRLAYFNFNDGAGWRWHDSLATTGQSLQEFGSNTTYTAASRSVTVTASDVAPVNTTAPSVSGTAKIDETLTANNGIWSAIPPVPDPSGYSYRWQRCETNSVAGVNWTTRDAPDSFGWRSVAWGGGRFVAVGGDVGYDSSDDVLTSTDGVTWNTQTPAQNNYWQSVAYGNGTFVAVSAGGQDQVMTSPDGITWTARTGSELEAWKSVTWGGPAGQEKFVAVADTGGIMTSTNGINWTSQVEPAVGRDWRSVTWGDPPGSTPGQFVAVAYGGSAAQQVMTSPDGINWTFRTSAVERGWFGVTWGGPVGQEKFVAVAMARGSGNRVMTSPDGITWTARTTPSDQFWNSVAWGGPPGQETFIAVSDTGAPDQVMTSPDGVTWTLRSSSSGQKWRAVTWGGPPGQQQFVSVAYDQPSNPPTNAGSGPNRVMTSQGASCTNIDDATNSTYTAQTDDFNKYLRVRVTASNGVTPDGVAYSPLSSQVAGIPPTNDTPPSVSGTPTVRQTLTADPGTWSGNPVPTFSYQWQRCTSNTDPASCTGITGTNSSTYVLQPADVGKYLRVEVTAVNGVSPDGVASSQAPFSGPVEAGPPKTLFVNKYSPNASDTPGCEDPDFTEIGSADPSFGAVGAAVSGDTIFICGSPTAATDPLTATTGPYIPNVILGTKSLTFEGDGPTRTILDGQNDRTPFYANLYDSGQSNSYLNLEEMTIKRGRDINSGGGVEAICRDVNIANAHFTDNKAIGFGQGGGAMFVYGDGNCPNQGDVTVESSVLTGNTAEHLIDYGQGASDGGAIIAYGTVTVTDSRFESNQTKATAASPGAPRGGAVWATNGVSISNSIFTSNSAVGPGAFGGAIYAGGSVSTGGNSEFRGNSADGRGGAILANGPGLMALTDTVFIENSTATGSGGAVFSIGPTSVEGSVLESNVAGAVAGGGGAADGGAIWAQGDVEVSESLFEDNSAPGLGRSGVGGAVASVGKITAEASDFAGNSANQWGGGLSAGAGVEIGNSGFQDNEVTGNGAYGGAIYAQNVSSMIEGSTFNGNEAKAEDAFGGAIRTFAAGLEVTNSTFTGNEAFADAAISGSDDVRLENVTSSANIGPFTIRSGGILTIGNSIIDESGEACVATVREENLGGNVIANTTAASCNPFVGTGGGPVTKVPADDIDLQPLADNGGSTETMALGLGSVARTSAGANLLGADPKDQRGLDRPATNQSSGAYQLTTEQLTVTKAGAGSGTVTSSPAGIDCGPACADQSVQFAQNPPFTTVTLTATAASGSVFTGWSGAGCTDTGPCEVPLDQARSVTATFIPSHQLSVTKAGTGAGTVTSSPAGIDCGTDCDHSYAQGATVTLSANAASGSTFTGWSGSGCSGTGSCEVTMSEARSISANFTQDSPPPPSGKPRLEITFKGPKRIRAGRPFTLEVTVSNRAAQAAGASRSTEAVDPTTATSVTTCLVMPKNAVIVRRGGGTVLRKKVCWTDDTLPAGTSVTHSLRARTTRAASGRITFRATASGENAEGSTTTASGVDRIKVKPARKPEPKPPTG